MRSKRLGVLLSAAVILAMVFSAVFNITSAQAGETIQGAPTSNDSRFATHITDPRIYPVGQQMAVGLYDSDGDVASLRAAGWNLFHTYGDSLALAAEAQSAGAGILGTLPGTSLPVSGSLTSDELKAYQDLAQTGAVTWWDLPEERDWSIPEEMRIIEEYAKLIRSVPQPLPTYMYIPGDYDAQEISKYLPYLDIVPAAVYPGYANKPYAWSRWRMETTVKGILDGGAVIGKDYRAGQKTPVAVLELFYDPKYNGHLISAAGAYHDFWQVLVSGAQGILIYSYARRNDDPTCQAAWVSLQQAMGELLGTERLDQVFLWGEPTPGIHASVIAGPTSTLTFAPLPQKPDLFVIYDAVDLTARQVGSTLYVVVVNSAEEKVTVKLSGLSNATQAEVLFHNLNPLPVSNNSVVLDLEALGVRILKIHNCAASVSSSLVLHIPIITYSGSNYWADLQYNAANSNLTVANAGIVNDVSFYSNCTASTLSSDFKLHIPVLMLNNISYWVDLQYSNSVFVITGYGQN